MVGHIILFIKFLQYLDFFKLHSVTLKLVDEKLKLAGIANYQCLGMVWKSTWDTFILINSNKQGTYCTGKTGKMVNKSSCQGKHREFGNFAKTQGKHREFGSLSQVVNSPILKVDLKDISIFAAKIPKFFLKLDMSTKSV